MAPIAMTREISDAPIKAPINIDQFNKGDNHTIDLVLPQFRCLIADIGQQYNGGHAALDNPLKYHKTNAGNTFSLREPWGMAAIGIALWKYVMKYSPNNPDYYDRDRFVLTNGHTAFSSTASCTSQGIKR